MKYQCKVALDCLSSFPVTSHFVNRLGSGPWALGRSRTKCPDFHYTSVSVDSVNTAEYFYWIFAGPTDIHSIPHRKCEGAEILRECSSHTMCHVSAFMCHLSCVTCHVSPVTFHLSHVKKKYILFFFFTKKLIILNIFWQSGGASWWRVCYQWGLTRLVN